MLAVSVSGIALGLFMTGVVRFNSDVDPTGNSAVAFELPGPQSVQDLVNRGDAIVIASIASVGETRYEGAFATTTGAFAVVTPEVGQPTLGFPVTYYGLDIEEILVDDGLIRQTPVIRVLGAPGSDSQPLEGHRYLYVLGRNPDGTSYGRYASWAQLDLTGKVAKDARGLDVRYASNGRPTEFLKEIREKLPNRVPTGRSDWVRQWAESLQP
jgi:hypothetical protein